MTVNLSLLETYRFVISSEDSAFAWVEKRSGGL